MASRRNTLSSYEDFVDTIVNSILNKECVFLLGPNFSFKDENTFQEHHSTQNELINFAADNYNLNIQKDQDSLYLIKSNAERLRFAQTMGNYIIEKFGLNSMSPDEVQVPDYLSRIVDIPTHLIISLSPDQIIEEAFKVKEFKYNFAYYNKKKNIEFDEKFDSENPIIYNLFGSIYDSQSLILTQTDLFEFVFSILKDKIPFPEFIKSAIKQTKLFIFLGCDFDQWYLRMIIKILNDLYNKDEGFNLALEPKKGLPNNIKVCFSDHFDVVFVSENSGNGYVDPPEAPQNDPDNFKTGQFIEKLHETLAAKNHLRKPSPRLYTSTKGNDKRSALTIAEKNALRFIEEGATYKALKEVAKNYAHDSENQGVVIVLLGTYNTIKSLKNEGTISEDGWLGEIKKIHSALKSIILDKRSED